MVAVAGAIAGICTAAEALGTTATRRTMTAMATARASDCISVVTGMGIATIGTIIATTARVVR